MSKPKLATVWLAGCSGCHMSFLDIDERILDLAALVDIVKCPIVDAKEFPEADIALVEGAVASDEHLHEIRLIRERSKILAAFGDCAVTANVSGYRNVVGKEASLQRAYVEAESNDGRGELPDSPEIQTLIDRVIPLHEAVKVDYYIPGCPPSADLIYYVVHELVHGRIPNLEEGKLKYG